MSNRAKPRKSVILRIVLLLFSVYIVVSLGKLQLQLIEKRNAYNGLLSTSTDKQLKVSELTRLLENGTESEYIERAARERLGYVYSDEQVYVDRSGN